MDLPVRQNKIETKLNALPCNDFSSWVVIVVLNESQRPDQCLHRAGFQPEVILLSYTKHTQSHTCTSPPQATALNEFQSGSPGGRLHWTCTSVCSLPHSNTDRALADLIWPLQAQRRRPRPPIEFP